VVAERDHAAVVREEFERAASGFARRTVGRFDHLDVVAFSRAPQGSSVIEVGAGTGNFLSLFAPIAARLVATDLTPGMLRVARELHALAQLVCGDGARLPFADASFDLVTSAHAMHHIPEPVAVLREMARIVAPRGHVLVVDLTAADDRDAAARADEVMTIRDPSHARSLTTGEMRAALEESGMTVVDHRIVDRRGLVSNWMWPGEFPEERIAEVRAYVERHWHEIGMDLQPEGDDFTYLDRRQMFLAARP
jgi:ubiquinone/menaquinone biosynthesis C-methylase UbiE